MPDPDLQAPWSKLRRSGYCGERVPPSRGVARGSAKLIRAGEMHMRRHVATFVAAALMLTLAAPVAAVDPTAPSESPSVSVGPSIDPAQTTNPDPAPAATPSPNDTPAGAATPTPSDAPAVTAAPSTKGRPALEDAQSAVDPSGRWIVLYRPGTNAAASSARQAKGGG